LAAFGVILAAGFGLLWLDREPLTPKIDVNAQFVAHAGVSTALTDDMPVSTPLTPHSLAMVEENGKSVIKFQLRPDGDEIVLDANTGRFIEARPPSASRIPAAGGKFAAPFAPMM